MINDSDLKHLQRCMELARAALEVGDEPFGSVLVSADGVVLAEAHGWVGLGRIVYASSSEQLAQWLSEMGVAASRVRNLRIQDVIRDTVVDGPVPELADQVRELHRQFYSTSK